MADPDRRASDPAASGAELELRPLSARSIVLSLLLGSHPASRPVGELVTLVGELGVSDATLRVALSRMLSAGDLVRDDGHYALSPRLLERQRRQDEAVSPVTVDDDGAWSMVVVTTLGREAARRQELRRDLTALRLGELREGTWLRPANLVLELTEPVAAETTSFVVRPDDDPLALVARLWDLDGWADHGHRLLRHLDGASDPARRITVAAAIVRHLLTDPVLPAALQPAGWPAAELRAAYAQYQRSEELSLVEPAGSPAR